jgi:hypothetical protein
VADSEDLTSRTLGDIDLTGSTPLFAVDLERQVAIADPPPGSDEGTGVAARLARVERLLEADLAALGPSVVTASIEEISTRLESLSSHVEVVGSRWERAEERLAVQLGVRVKERLDGLDQRVERLTRLVEAATEPEPEGTLTPTDVALRGILARLDSLTAEVARLVALAELDPGR